MIRFLISLPFLLFMLIAPEPEEKSVTGELRGTISITRDDSNDLLGRQFIANRYHSRQFRIDEPAQDAGGLRYSIPEKAVVYLEPKDPEVRLVPSGRTRRVVLDQRSLMFYPQVLAVERGATVIFPNNDNVYHNVFSYSKAKQFDLGRYPKGHFRTVQFDEPGVVRLYCDIHAHMNAVILVFDHPYFTTPNESGDYRLLHVPPGLYTVHLWYGRNLVESREVKIDAEKSHILNFTY